jgi:methionyl-tRNA formyltransferase
VETSGGGRLGVRRARAAPELDAPGPGELSTAGGRLVLGTAGGALELVEVLPPGGRAMAADAYLRGSVEPQRAPGG